MTYQRNDERREAIWQYFKDYHEMSGRCPTMQECGDVIGASKSAVKHYILGFEREGKMKIIKRRVYLLDDNGNVIDKRKSLNQKVRRQQGVAGAEALKKLSLEKGVERFTAGMGADEASIQRNIERIVENAIKKGTYFHPRPNYVVPIGQKVG